MIPFVHGAPSPYKFTGAGGINPVTAGFTGFGSGGVGNVANSSSGTDKVMVAGSVYWVALPIWFNCTLTGLQMFTGTVGAVDNWIVALYNSAGTLLANSALAGTVAPASNTKKRFPFTGTVNVTGPGVFYAALQSNGTTARFLAHPNTTEGFVTGSTTGSFGTLPGPLTPGTTYTFGVGPFCNTY